MKEHLGADQRPVERPGKDRVEVEQRYRWDQEVRLVQSAEVHRPGPCPSQQHYSCYYRANQEHDRQRG
jgi:hypothetical protein